MAQTKMMIEALKKALKAHGLTYRDVAKMLSLSEASVKRLFAREDFTLARLDLICQQMGLEIADLARMVDAQMRHLKELTEDQEQQLVADPNLLLVTFLVINGWSFQQMLEHYKLPESQLIRCLARLDRLKLIQLLPKNRTKLLVAPNFSWRRNGPIYQFFIRHLQKDFLDSRFDKDGETFHFLSGMISETSRAQLAAKLEQLSNDFNDRNRHDMHLPPRQRDLCGMVLAIRPWRPAAFAKFRKE